MKSKIFLLFISFLSLESRELGEFVKEIPLKPIVFEIPEIEKTKTASGIEILSLKNSEFPIVYADILIYHGNKNLGKRSLSISRILESSWALSGSKGLPGESYLQKFESLGVAFSVGIDYDKTIIQIAYLKSTENQVLPMLEAFLENPNLTKEAFDNSKRKLKEEISRRNDNPQSLGSRKMKEALFFGTIQGRSIQPKEIEDVQIADVESFQKEIISEQKKLILLSGDFELASWSSFLSKATSAIKDKATEEIDTFTLERNIQKYKSDIRLVDKDVQQSFISMVGVLPAHKHKDFYAIQILNYIIGGGGFNSYFMREIRNNRGLAYSAGSVTNFQESYGTIQFYAMTKTESVPEVLKLMKELVQMDLILQLKEEELVRAKNAIINQFVFQFEDSKRTLSSEVRRRDHSMPETYMKDFRKNIEAVSLEDMKKVGYQYFRNDSLIVTIVGPKSIRNQLKGNVKVISPEE